MIHLIRQVGFYIEVGLEVLQNFISGGTDLLKQAQERARIFLDNNDRQLHRFAEIFV